MVFRIFDEFRTRFREVTLGAVAVAAGAQAAAMMAVERWNREHRVRTGLALNRAFADWRLGQHCEAISSHFDRAPRAARARGARGNT